MGGSLYLMAYPDWRRIEVVRWHQAMFEEIGKSHPHVALFAASGGEDPEEIRWVSDSFQWRFNAIVEPVRLLRRKTPSAEARAIILRSDVIYCTGGDHFLMVRAVYEAGLADTLKQRVKRGAVVGAYSAGAIAVGPYWPEWPEPPQPDLPEEGASLVRCLGLNNQFICDFHSEEDDWEELRACLRLLRDKDSRKTWYGYGVPMRGAVRILRSGAIECMGDKGPWLRTGPNGVESSPSPE